MSYDTASIIVTGAQMRAARALLNWTGQRLAQESSVSLPTIRRAELIDGRSRMTAANARAIRATLEAAGVEFIAENGGGAGVRLQRPSPKR